MALRELVLENAVLLHGRISTEKRYMQDKEPEKSQMEESTRQIVKCYRNMAWCLLSLEPSSVFSQDFPCIAIYSRDE